MLRIGGEMLRAQAPRSRVSSTGQTAGGICATLKRMKSGAVWLGLNTLPGASTTPASRTTNAICAVYALCVGGAKRFARGRQRTGSSGARASRITATARASRASASGQPSCAEACRT